MDLLILFFLNTLRVLENDINLVKVNHLPQEHIGTEIHERHVFSKNPSRLKLVMKHIITMSTVFVEHQSQLPHLVGFNKGTRLIIPKDLPM